MLAHTIMSSAQGATNIVKIPTRKQIRFIVNVEPASKRKKPIFLCICQQLNREMTKHAKHVTDFYKNLTTASRDSCDIGSVLQELIAKTSPYIPLPLQLFTDGLQIHKSNKNSLWPILLVQNYLPPQIISPK